MLEYNEDGTLKGRKGRLARTLSMGVEPIKVPLFTTASKDPNLYSLDGMSYQTGHGLCKTFVVLSVAKVRQEYHWNISICQPYGNFTHDSLHFTTEERNEEEAFKIAMEVIKNQEAKNIA